MDTINAHCCSGFSSFYFPRIVQHDKIHKRPAKLAHMRLYQFVNDILILIKCIRGFQEGTVIIYAKGLEVSLDPC